MDITSGKRKKGIIKTYKGQGDKEHNRMFQY